MKHLKPFHIVHVSSLPPTACGVAEYSAALATAMNANWPQASHFFVRLDSEAKETLQDDQQISINPVDPMAFKVAADAVNRLERKVVLVQHEFKLFGGADGENICGFLAALDCPIATTLHTVWPLFTPVRQRIFSEVLRLSDKVIIFSEVAATIIRANHGVAADKIQVIPHGVPDVPFLQPGTSELLNVPQRSVRFITTGLLRPAKGIEHVIAAMGEVRKRFSDFAYVICGADHPRSPYAGEYRNKILAAVSHHGLENHVFFVNRFLDWPELIAAIQACDVGILTYTLPEQSSSGVLALTLACGRPVITTDFQHAKATVDGNNGILVPAGDTNALISAVEALVQDDNLRIRMAETSYSSTRSWVWPQVAQKHREVLGDMCA